ncbi:hypothetical protein ZEAMMB73_Zm00001d045332 [Zea mays]|uniref:Uncharacterized protein n=1 Tax=Zea mays TaxID=4577 RepID=A0A1D6NVB7_MAIZE|nr:hypothetical protein ZEAMMB73_Zm00001d045332 [Zea mays]
MAPRILIFKPRTNKSRSDRDPHAVLPVNYHLLNSHAMDCSDIPALCAVKELISITSRRRPHSSRPAPQPKSSCDREPLAAARKIVSHQPTGYRSRAPRSRSSADLLPWKPNDLAIAASCAEDLVQSSPPGPHTSSGAEDREPPVDGISVASSA